MNLSQLEHLQSKYVGTGSADTTKEELLLTQQRDTYASLLGHHNMLVYMSTAENQSLARTRLRLLEAMVKPTLLPPSRTAKKQ